MNGLCERCLEITCECLTERSVPERTHALPSMASFRDMSFLVNNVVYRPVKVDFERQIDPFAHSFVNRVMLTLEGVELLQS